MAKKDSAHESIFLIALCSQPHSKISQSLSPCRPLKAFDPVNIITGESMSARETERFHNEEKMGGGMKATFKKKGGGSIFIHRKCSYTAGWRLKAA